MPDAAGVATANQGPIVATSSSTATTRSSVTRPGEDDDGSEAAGWDGDAFIVASLPRAPDSGA
ncbi:hypothetical protein GCM10025792_08760 [Pseudonocardia tropica]